MVSMRTLPILAFAALILGACNTVAAPAAPGAASAKAVAPEVQGGYDFAQAHCSTCHAVVPLKLSPNPESPPFQAIVSRPGLTGATLKTFLRDSHNFPEIMDFDIDSDQIDALAAYMLTLQERD